MIHSPQEFFIEYKNEKILVGTEHKISEKVKKSVIKELSMNEIDLYSLPMDEAVGLIWINNNENLVDIQVYDWVFNFCNKEPKGLY